MTKWIVIDVASAPLADAAAYLEPAKAPGNYKDPEKIAAYIAEKNAERLAMAATDIDLARITGLAWQTDRMTQPIIVLCQTEDHERLGLTDIANVLRNEIGTVIPVVTYGGHGFDLPLLMRRARYLGVPFPHLSTDRFKSSNIDVLLELSDRNPSRARALSFYVRRLGMELVKPLSGEEEARVPETGRWDELTDSLRHDLEATRRLGVWMGLL